MEFERTSMALIQEIDRLIKSGLTDRKIARSLKCRRSLVAGVRSGKVYGTLIDAAKKERAAIVPDWALSLNWQAVEKDIREGHQIKRIWEESADQLTSHPNFFKYMKKRFAQLLAATVTLRSFRPGEHCEVDYAGDKIEWIDKKTGEIHQAHVFVGILCFSQKIFAIAAEDEKKRNWLFSHRRMFEFYGGAAQVLVPDQLKNGVIKSHRYDPDLNPDYVELATHYGVSVVPARVRRPKDKALVEGAVGILMRYFRFVYRRHTFHSMTEINQALIKTLQKINEKPHTRFKTSRSERFETLEKATLLTLPLEPYAIGEWRTAVVHPDCTIAVEHNYYSVPHIYRGKELRVKVSDQVVEAFLDLDRVAVHARMKGKVGERILEPTHLPENSRAYLEATPQTLLAHAKFSHPDLHALIDELFKENTLGNLRRAQGLVRRAYAAIKAHGREAASPWIAVAVAQMRRFGKIRVKAFEDTIKAEMKKKSISQVDRSIERKPGNPMVRGHGRSAAQGTLPLPIPGLRLVSGQNADQKCSEGSKI